MGSGRHWKSRLALAVVATTILTVILSVAHRLDPLAQGLHAEYFSNATWDSAATASRRESQPSTEHLVEAWHGSPPEVFSTSWTGSVIALRQGTYTFATASDDGSSVFIDGRLVVDNGGRHGTQVATGSVHLDRGAHALFIRYAQEGGAYDFNFLWARDGSRLEPVPAWALGPHRASLGRLTPTLLLDLSLVATEWLWVGFLLLAGAAAVWPWVSRMRAYVERHCAWSALRPIVAGSLALNLAGIWWGLPDSWVQNELTPTLLLDGVSQRFSHGWFDTYPPVHFFILTIATSPVLLLQFLGRVNISGLAGHTVMVVITRLVSVAAGAGTVIATCLCGSHAFGKRAGLFAAAIFAMVAPFIYYSKTANVDAPYLFWWAVSLVFYLRLLDRLRLQDFLLFAVTATLAVCTKDQAYALYLLAPLVIVHQMWRANRGAGFSRPFWRAVFDRRLAAAAIAAAVLFAVCQNLLFNSDGFLYHVRYITGSGSVPYRVFEPTGAGRLALLRLSLHLIELSMGWPLFLVCATGLLIAAATPRLRRTTAWLTVPVVSYYVGFINVILYNYDRFVLPVCLVLALFGGFALDAFLTSSRRGRTWRTVAVTSVFAYSLLYAATVDVLMIEESRYAVERWMQTNVSIDDLVGVTGLLELLPRLDDFHCVAIGTVAELQRERPRYVVMNADYARAVSPDRPWGQLIAGLHHGTLGYRLVFRFRRDSPWPWLPGGHQDLVGPRQETVVFSILRNINPMIEVFQRDPSGSGQPDGH